MNFSLPYFTVKLTRGSKTSNDFLKNIKDRKI